MAVSEQVRVLFDPDSEYAALLPQQATLQRALTLLNDTATIPAETWAQDEVLGWVYQYFNAEEEKSIRDTKKKFVGDDIVPVTQRYTERFMVDYLLQNTLGQLWTELRLDTRLRERWPYYVTPLTGNSPVVRAPKRVRDITVLDPCCGSGHFLLRAFDLLADMYAEEGLERAEDVPGLILERNLYGIDIDLRAVQIAALGLYMKARVLAGPGFRPARLNLVAADATLPRETPPTKYLRRFGSDEELVNLVRDLWTGLRNVRELGSLLHPERPISELIARRKQDHQMRFGQIAPGSTEWEQYKRDLLEGLREEFERQASSQDLGQRLFGQEAAKGIDLINALSQCYDVVITNPPYIGSANMGECLKSLVETEYATSKSDVYAAFIERCRGFCHSNSYLGMVTQQTWIYQKALTLLRKDLLESTTITGFVHLGTRAFTDVVGEVVNVCLFTLTNNPAMASHHFLSFRIVAPQVPADKDKLLLDALNSHASDVKYISRQSAFLGVPGHTIAYAVHPRLLELFPRAHKLKVLSPALDGISTTDNDQFLRNVWEIGFADSHWRPYVKGGNTQRWFGLNQWSILWSNNGEQLKMFVTKIKGHSHWSRQIRSADKQFAVRGLTYSLMGSGKLGVRSLPTGTGWDTASITIVPDERYLCGLLAYLNTRIATMLARVLSPELKFRGGYISQMPIPPSDTLESGKLLSEIGKFALSLAAQRGRQDPSERYFQDILPFDAIVSGRASDMRQRVDTWLAASEACIEIVASQALGLDEEQLPSSLAEIGTPAGWNRLVAGYDAIPPLPAQIKSAPSEVISNLADYSRKSFSSQEIGILKNRLRSLYVTGHSQHDISEESEQDSNEGDSEREDETVIVGARIPIRPESTIEMLSERLSIHPISVYWLLKEMREQEGLVSPPEVKRQLEDWASVSLLRLLGYRWPEQDAYEREHGPILDPALVDEDGIIPLVRCTPGQPTAYERLGLRLERDFGLDGREQSEREFRQYVGRDLDTWLKKDCFKRHIQLFKQRPIAWHVVSPERTFEAFVLYHRLSRETLQKLRTQYAGALIERLRAEQAQARSQGDSARVTDLGVKIEDVDEFRQRLEQIERGDEIQHRIRCRWKGESETGRPGPYAPDLDDGVKVNIRPFQETGLLAVKQVIKKW